MFGLFKRRWTPERLAAEIERAFAGVGTTTTGYGVAVIHQDDVVALARLDDDGHEVDLVMTETCPLVVAAVGPA